MNVTAKHTWFRSTLLALAATFVLGGCVAPAYAHDWDDGDGWRRHEWREHEHREHEWREHEWRERHPYYSYDYYGYPSGYVQTPNYWWGR